MIVKLLPLGIKKRWKCHFATKLNKGGNDALSLSIYGIAILPVDFVADYMAMLAFKGFATLPLTYINILFFSSK
ncbi:MAG: hypothetical protein N4A43_02470 [Alphaproteobacteria bacterium]|jgi:hypothetical protein|nr:hypothetical protein [Alphaproteobacteria bacterium]